MITYKVLMNPVLIFGIPFELFYGILFFGVAIFMGTLNLIIPLMMLLVFWVIRVMIKTDFYFFSILARSLSYPRVIN